MAGSVFSFECQFRQIQPSSLWPCGDFLAKRRNFLKQGAFVEVPSSCSAGISGCEVTWRSGGLVTATLVAPPDGVYLLQPVEPSLVLTWSDSTLRKKRKELTVRTKFDLQKDWEERRVSEQLWILLSGSSWIICGWLNYQWSFQVLGPTEPPRKPETNRKTHKTPLLRGGWVGWWWWHPWYQLISYQWTAGSVKDLDGMMTSNWPIMLGRFETTNQWNYWNTHSNKTRDSTWFHLGDKANVGKKLVDSFSHVWSCLTLNSSDVCWIFRVISASNLADL
jgi:hypothetical protein